MFWSDHIDTLCKKVSQRLGVLRRVKYLLPLHERLTVYDSLILLLFDYADTVWGDKNNEVLTHNLQVLQNNAARIILDLPKYFFGTQALAVKLDTFSGTSTSTSLHCCLQMRKQIDKFQF